MKLMTPGTTGAYVKRTLTLTTRWCYTPEDWRRTPAASQRRKSVASRRLGEGYGFIEALHCSWE
ncbi:hypothetical protein DPMN_062724 [Dreissena polymorpha]|uniref:Uncharacterized protein n=1 Tax=Dreissena polymorpha TaxID=45954 RepID=A0A9D4HHZ8_DREPO|nr:hypothetical protein DPMN_062724 [Dreissena polymorpha]